jgi:hypothetical protein
MPFFKFLIRGDDVDAPPGTHGFFIVRSAFGSTEAVARSKVLRSVEHELMHGKSAASWRSSLPQMEIEQADRIGLLDVRRRHSGFIFYRNDGCEKE